MQFFKEKLQKVKVERSIGSAMNYQYDPFDGSPDPLPAESPENKAVPQQKTNSWRPFLLLFLLQLTPLGTALLAVFLQFPLLILPYIVSAAFGFAGFVYRKKIAHKWMRITIMVLSAINVALMPILFLIVFIDLAGFFFSLL